MKKNKPTKVQSQPEVKIPSKEDKLKTLKALAYEKIMLIEQCNLTIQKQQQELLPIQQEIFKLQQSNE